MKQSDELTVLKGIGEKTKQTFHRAGIDTVGQLIEYYPRAYDLLEEVTDIDKLTDGCRAAVCGFLKQTLSVKRIGQFQITTGKIYDSTGVLSVTWFHMPYLRGTVHPGHQYIFRGRIKKKGNSFVMEQPALYDPAVYDEKRKALQPVYPLVSGLSQNMLVKTLHQALEELDLSVDYLPAAISSKYQLISYEAAIHEVHFPKTADSLAPARRRLVFDEFFLFILALRHFKEAKEYSSHSYRLNDTNAAARVLDSLPYQLTNAQQNVWHTIKEEMQSEKVMARLIQGDVGSGKTIIAFLALVMAASNQCQGALMVPTEVLAKQHYVSFCELMKMAGLPYRAVLLTGSMTVREKREACREIAEGEVSVIIGTHALIQDKVVYHKLVLVITDEQHRFGVKQRETLSFKGELPHTIVMSATPIPRSLAVILYGDLDISVIDELPANRLPIKNCVVNKSYRPKAYRFIEKEIAAGHQAYVICPMVEESELIDAENVMDYTEHLRQIFPSNIQVGLLHGKMKSQEKNEIMERFLRNEIQVLVSTTVVEVGVNVPNATVMMIENAERFGLAQLHQLRGRVGRGRDQSYCIMIQGTGQEQILERLEILNRSNDGFEIASEDLKLRGPGDLFGVRQSGELTFVLADVYTDAGIMQFADDAVTDLLEKDNKLERSEHAVLKEKMILYMQNGLENLNI